VTVRGGAALPEPSPGALAVRTVLVHVPLGAGQNLPMSCDSQGRGSRPVASGRRADSNPREHLPVSAAQAEQGLEPPARPPASRFVVRQTGTYWYHSHQVSHEQVRGGLLGALLMLPPQAPGGAGTGSLEDVDVPDRPPAEWCRTPVRGA